MSENLKHTIYSPGDCLSEKRLFDYIDNKLSPKERHIVEKHLLDCELCSDALEGLELVKDRNRIVLIKEAINKKILSSTKKEALVVSFNYKMAFSVAAAIALLVVGVFFFNKINLKEASMSSDLAELKEKESSPAAPPLSESANEIADSTGQTRATVTSAKSEADKSGPGNVVDEGIAFAAEQKPDFYKSKEGTGENTNQEIPPMVAGNATVIATDAIAMPRDDRKNVQLETASAPKSSAAEREKNAKLDDTKKAEEKTIAGATGGTSYSWSTAPEQKQKNTANNAASGEKIELAKKADKDSEGKNRSQGKLFEQKDKDKKSQVVTKENNKNEDAEIGDGLSAPQSVAQDTDELRFKAAVSTTTSIDSIGQIFSIADQMPEYPGGNDSMIKFINANFLSGKISDQSNPITTKIYVQFIVTKDGNIINPKIIKGITPELDKEAIRVVKMMPKWKPGKQNGKAVSVSYNISLQQKIK